MIQSAFDLTTPGEDADVLAVLHLIRQHLGHECAVSMHEIERVTGIQARQVQTIVKLLVEERHFPIGTSARKPWGYYWILTERERRDVMGHLLRRALSTLKHARALDSDAVVAPLVGQLELVMAPEDTCK